MAENYREQQQEETEGIVDAGGFENDPGTGMIAEDQETAAAADAQPNVPAAVPAQDDEEAIEETEASENVHVDLHEDTGSGVDLAVIIIVLLLVISCTWYAFLQASIQPAPESQIIAEQQAAQGNGEDPEYESPYEVAELSEGVAAVVNGEEIPEETITTYIANYRDLYSYTDDGMWGAWMLVYGFTPETLRSTILSGYIDEALVRQAIEEHGIEVSQERVDEIYNAARESYDTEEEWLEGLELGNLTPEAFREQCWQQAANQALAEYLGEQWFTPEEEDAELLVAVKQYYPEYAEVESLDGIPEEKLEPVREMVVYYAQQDAYSKFLNDAKENGDIKVSAMPSDVPYDANMLLGYITYIANQLQFQNQE